MEYILANGLDHVGSLAFSPENFNEPMKLTPLSFSKDKLQDKKLKLKVIMDQKELFLAHEEDHEKVEEILNYGPSLGGARPKFNIAIEGVEYLAKYSVSLDKNAWRLSSLYDVVAKDVSTANFSLAMKIGLEKRKASEKNLVSACDFF
jgi:hypothetical protein